MFSLEVGLTGGEAKAHATSGRGHPPEFWAERLIAKLIVVSDNAHPMIREQARAFKDRAQSLILVYMKNAIRSDRTTLAEALKKAGQHEAAAIILKL